MAKKFPKTIFVKREKSGAVDFLVADEDEYALCEKDEIVEIAEYELVTTRKRRLVMFHT